MKFFTAEEFLEEYKEYKNIEIPNRYIKNACEIIFSQIGLRYRDTTWDKDSVPEPVKDASMEQLRFMLEHDLPFIDTNELNAGSMKAKINSDYSTLALRILANHGYLFRGSPINSNMSLNIPFGGC